MKLDIQLFAMQPGANGTIPVSAPTNRTEQKVEYSETYDIETNKSLVTSVAYIRRYSNTTTGTMSGNITIDGQSFPISRYGNIGTEWVEIGRASKEIEHEPDGKKSIVISAEWYNTGTSLAGTYSGTSTVALTTIPRSSTIACSEAYVGENAVITINKASPDFTSTLSWFNTTVGSRQTIVEKTDLASYIWQVPSPMTESEYYSTYYNIANVPVSLWCETYNGNTKIGEKQIIIYIKARRENNMPIIDGEVIDINSSTIALTDDAHTLVKNESIAVATISATPQNSALIYRRVINNINAQLTDEEYQVQFDDVNTNIFNFFALDSRDFSNSVVVTKKMIDYIPLTLSYLFERNEPTDDKVNLTCSGNYFNSGFKYTLTIDTVYDNSKTYFILVNNIFTKANITEFEPDVQYYEVTNSNHLLVEYRYRNSNTQDFSDWITVTPTITGNTYTLTNFDLGANFDYNSSFIFEIKVVDELHIIHIQNISVGKGKPVANGYEDENGNDVFNIPGTLAIKDIPVMEYEVVDEGQNSRAIKFKNNDYLDSSGIVHNRNKLNEILNEPSIVILYENASGGTGALELTDSALNYKKLEIFFQNTSNDKFVMITGNAGGYPITTSSTGSFNGYYALRLAGGKIFVDKTSLILYPTGSNYTVDLKTNGTFVFSDTATTYKITKVLAYK